MSITFAMFSLTMVKNWFLLLYSQLQTAGTWCTWVSWVITKLKTQNVPASLISLTTWQWGRQVCSSRQPLPGAHKDSRILVKNPLQQIILYLSHYIAFPPLTLKVNDKWAYSTSARWLKCGCFLSELEGKFCISQPGLFATNVPWM